MTDAKHDAPEIKIGVLVSLIPVIALLIALWLAVVVYKDRGLTSHIPLIFAAVVGGIVARACGIKWIRLKRGMVDSISIAMNAMLILLVIGTLISMWIQAGIVPTMIFYGLDLISPRWFLPAACLTCSFVSLATGSSWSTVATVGIALMGVGVGLDIPRPMIAGAIISGAYFGDKISPLSDTTNLAPATVGVDLFVHIRHMLYTTLPSLFLALIGFTLLGFGFSKPSAGGDVVVLQNAIGAVFEIHPLLLVPPLLVIVMVVLKLPALPSIVGGAVIGALIAVGVQGASLGEVLETAYGGFVSTSGDTGVDGLLSRGGLSSMYSTVALIILALSFGGIMERSGMLDALARPIMTMARNVFGLIVATLMTCFGMNVLASDQYLAIVLPGRMYAGEYKKRGLMMKNLSRTLEDSGTLTSVLIPWNTCGAFMIATLDITPWLYVPFCFLNLINPLVAAFYGFTGLTIHKEEAA